jgi:hypothetical protein
MRFILFFLIGMLCSTTICRAENGAIQLINSLFKNVSSAKISVDCKFDGGVLAETGPYVCSMDLPRSEYARLANFLIKGMTDSQKMEGSTFQTLCRKARCVTSCDRVFREPSFLDVIFLPTPYERNYAATETLFYSQKEQKICILVRTFWG